MHKYFGFYFENYKALHLPSILRMNQSFDIVLMEQRYTIMSMFNIDLSFNSQQTDL